MTLWLRREGSWFGIAEFREGLVATSVASSKEEATSILFGCLPKGAPFIMGEGESAYADRIALVLASIEEKGEGDVEGIRLSPDYHPEPASSVYRLVSTIPLGYATSYGRVAVATGAIAREVGRLMAGNPLYPLVPCHRVVGADYSLVGYRGATSGPDLDDKLDRLRAESRGFGSERELPGTGGLLVFPVEWVVAKAESGKGDEERQLSLW